MGRKGNVCSRERKHFLPTLTTKPEDFLWSQGHASWKETLLLRIFFFFFEKHSGTLRSTGQVPTDKHEQKNLIFLSDLTFTVPVQTLLCLLELSVDVPELVLNQRLLHVEHRVHYLRPNSGGRDAGTWCGFELPFGVYGSSILIKLLRGH